MGAPAAGALALLALGVVGVGASIVYAVGTGDLLLHYLVLGAFVLLWAGLLLRPGVAAANRHGAPPAALAPSFGSRGNRIGLAVAVLLMAAGVAIGAGANLWLEGLAEQRGRDQAAADRDTAGNAESPDNLEAIYEGQTR